MFPAPWNSFIYQPPRFEHLCGACKLIVLSTNLRAKQTIVFELHRVSFFFFFFLDDFFQPSSLNFLPCYCKTIWSTVRHWALGVFSWQHVFLKSTPRPSTYPGKARYPLKSHCTSSRILPLLFGKECSGHVGVLPKVGSQKKSTRERSPFLGSYGRASLHLHVSFFLSLFFLLPSQQGICCVASQPSDGNLQFSLRGHGQTKDPEIRSCFDWQPEFDVQNDSKWWIRNTEPRLSQDGHKATLGPSKK